MWNQDLTVWHALGSLRVVLAAEPESAALRTLQAELPTPSPEDLAVSVVVSMLDFLYAVNSVQFLVPTHRIS